MGVIDKLLPLALDYATRIPFEKLLFKPPDKTKPLKELQTILTQSSKPPTEPLEEAEPAESLEEEGDGIVRRRPHSGRPWAPPGTLAEKPLPPPGLTTEQTVDYGNKNIGKALLQMEKHFAQGLMIKGIACDCGSSRHLLFMEAECEDTMAMVDDPSIYQKIIDWVEEVGPKSSEAASRSREYADEYPLFSHQARDLRKELLGTLDISALFNGPLKGRFAGMKVKFVKPEPEALESPEEMLTLPEGKPVAEEEPPVDNQQSAG